MIYVPGKENMVKQACYAAADDAKKFMSRLFSGQTASRCECGREVKYANEKILCPECGKELDAVGYVQQYGDLFIKTTVFVDQKRFRLAVSTENDFDE